MARDEFTCLKAYLAVFDIFCNAFTYKPVGIGFVEEV